MNLLVCYIKRAILSEIFMTRSGFGTLGFAIKKTVVLSANLRAITSFWQLGLPLKISNKLLNWKLMNLLVCYIKRAILSETSGTWNA